MSYTAKLSGDLSTTDYRCYILNESGNVISPFHDIPLYVNKEKGICNMVVEIPKGTNAKMEISTTDNGNPIKQDTKKGKLRFVHDVYPYSGYIWNYGAFPQTWEYPDHTHEETKCNGDNDPLDVCEIGTKAGTSGEIKQVKVLGALALIDEGETDWKIMCIDVNDPIADEVNDMADVEKKYPGLSMASYEWFRTYKMPAGKPANNFAFDGAMKGRDYALQVVEENYVFWKDLVSGKVPSKTDSYEIAANNINVADSKYHVESYDVKFSEFKDKDISPKAFEAPENAIEKHVTLAQREHPHSVSSLSKIIRAVGEGLKADNTDEVIAAANTDNYWQVKYTKNGASAVAGIYQKKSPHAINHPNAAKVAEQGLDLVAAAFTSDDGSFSYSSGYGIATFNADGSLADSAKAAPSQTSDDLLSSVAPLAFLA